MSAFEEKVEISHSVLQLHHRVHVPLALADLSSFSLRVSATVHVFHLNGPLCQFLENSSGF